MFLSFTILATFFDTHIISSWAAKGGIARLWSADNYWKNFCKFSFDPEIKNAVVQAYRQGLQQILLIMANIHSKFETFIINSSPSMNLNAKEDNW